ncbi:MAG: hypothetical protein RJA70_2092 [Pseudomonadota bacterium]|jgi:hypothetical protein
MLSWSLDPAETLLLCRRLLGLSLLVSGAEHLRLARLLEARVPWAATVGEQGGYTILRLLGFAYARPVWTGLVAMLTLLAAGLLVTGEGALLGPVLLIAWLGCVRFGGTFNGGSDMMTFVVGLPLLLQFVFPSLGAVRDLAIGAIGTQLLLSYLLSGVGKLREPVWRDGTALSYLVNREQYRVPASLHRLLARPAPSRVLSYAVIVFECAAPLALLDLRLCYGYLALAFAFHLGVAVTLGLNRFVWAWLAAFPCLPGLVGLLNR